MIDHSLLQPTLTEYEIAEGINLALRYGVKLAMVRPTHVQFAKNLSQSSSLQIGTVIGFPFGYNTHEVKMLEAKIAVMHGADEFDMVLNIAALKSKQYDVVVKDIETVKQAVEMRPLKVILETAYLTDEEIEQGCWLSEQAGANFVKTSTGYAPEGAKVEHIKLMKESVSEKVEVKAAGKIRSLDYLLELYDAGATRFGLTATEAILNDFISRNK